MQVIIEHAEIVEAIRIYFLNKYGMVVTGAYTTYPYKQGRPRNIETIWAVEVPFAENHQRPKKQLHGAAEAEASQGYTAQQAPGPSAS